MWRMILIGILLPLFGAQAAYPEPPQPASPSAPSAAYTQYQPLIYKAARLEIVETARGGVPAYPTTYYLYGYVRNQTQEPLYEVVIDLEVTIWPYDDPPPPPYTETAHLVPAFTATLPGQVNPFYYSLTLGKASAEIGEILGYSASAWESGDRHAALTILNYQYAGAALSGTARNNTGWTLHGSRVVIFEPGLCAWREAVLDTTTLHPGDETGFHLDGYPSACVTGDLVVLGQGAYPP